MLLYKKIFEVTEMLENDGRADLFNGIEYFFDAIKAKCSSDEEYAAELLKARGFLLEDEGIILSDNSHPDDIKYLNGLLTKENIGEVKDGKIVIAPGGNVEKIFYSTYISGSEAFLAHGITWQRFINESFAPKVPLRLLEPFIGRYVKAISACGVQTHGSCDGNHLGRYGRRILIEISGEPDDLWHEIICNRLLYGRFKFRWHKECSSIIRFSKMNKWKVYTELNRAGEFLYNNRIKIRQIRREAADGITNSMARHLSYDELAAIFSERANELFDEFLNNA